MFLDAYVGQSLLQECDEHTWSDLIRKTRRPTTHRSQILLFRTKSRVWLKRFLACNYIRSIVSYDAHDMHGVHRLSMHDRGDIKPMNAFNSTNVDDWQMPMRSSQRHCNTSAHYAYCPVKHACAWVSKCDIAMSARQTSHQHRMSTLLLLDHALRIKPLTTQDAYTVHARTPPPAAPLQTADPTQLSVDPAHSRAHERVM